MTQIFQSPTRLEKRPSKRAQNRKDTPMLTLGGTVAIAHADAEFFLSLGAISRAGRFITTTTVRRVFRDRRDTGRRRLRRAPPPRVPPSSSRCRAAPGASDPRCVAHDMSDDPGDADVDDAGFLADAPGLVRALLESACEPRGAPRAVSEAGPCTSARAAPRCCTTSSRRSSARSRAGRARRTRTSRCSAAPPPPCSATPWRGPGAAPPSSPRAPPPRAETPRPGGPCRRSSRARPGASPLTAAIAHALGDRAEVRPRRGGPPGHARRRVLAAPGEECELMYGRAGYLHALLFARTRCRSNENEDEPALVPPEAFRGIVAQIVAEGVAGARRVVDESSTSTSTPTSTRLRLRLRLDVDFDSNPGALARVAREAVPRVRARRGRDPPHARAVRARARVGREGRVLGRVLGRRRRRDAPAAKRFLARPPRSRGTPSRSSARRSSTTATSPRASRARAGTSSCSGATARRVCSPSSPSASRTRAPRRRRRERSRRRFVRGGGDVAPRLTAKKARGCATARPGAGTRCCPRTPRPGTGGTSRGRGGSRGGRRRSPIGCRRRSRTRRGRCSRDSPAPRVSSPTPSTRNTRGSRVRGVSEARRGGGGPARV